MKRLMHHIWVGRIPALAVPFSHIEVAYLGNATKCLEGD